MSHNKINSKSCGIGEILLGAPSFSSLNRLFKVKQKGFARFALLLLSAGILTSCGPRPNQSPIASFTFEPNSGNPPLEVSFDASATTDPDLDEMSYVWKFGDGNVGNGITLKHTYNESGVYKVNLTVTDGREGVSSIDHTIRVNTAPIASFTVDQFSGNLPLVVEVDASASSDPEGDPISYSWKVGDDAMGEAVNMKLDLNSPGINVITLAVTDENGLSSEMTQEIKVNHPPQARFKVRPGGGNAPLKVTLNGTDSKDLDGEIVTYQWMINDEVVGNEANLDYIFEDPGVFSVILIVTDDKGVMVKANAKIKINGRPVINLSATPIAGTPPLEVTFDASETTDPENEAIDFEWDFGDGQTGEGPILTHLYESSGKYQVLLMATDIMGASESGERTIIVNRPPAPFVLAGPLSGHAPLTVVLDASRSADPDGDELAFSWNLGDGNSLEGTRVEHTYETEGSYAVSLTVSDSIESIIDQETNIEVLAPLPPVEPLNLKIYNVHGQIRFRMDDHVLYQGGITSYTKLDTSLLKPGMNLLVVECFQSTEESNQKRSRKDYSYFFTLLVDNNNRWSFIDKFGRNPVDAWFEVKTLYVGYEEQTGKVRVFEVLPEAEN